MKTSEKSTISMSIRACSERKIWQSFELQMQNIDTQEWVSPQPRPITEVLESPFFIQMEEVKHDD